MKRAARSGPPAHPARKPARTAGERRLPLRKSLLGRLLAVSALVAACSVAATAWLAAQTTSGAIRQEQGQNLADDARIYNTLLGYAATHPRWDAVETTVRELAQQSGRRIALTTQDRRTLADSAAPHGDGGGAEDGGADGPPPELPPRASAVVDPLSPDTALSPPADPSRAAAADRIDPRAVGPFRLPDDERAPLLRAAETTAACLGKYSIATDIVDSPSGRPRIQVVGSDERAEAARCSQDDLDRPTKTEAKALDALSKLTDACLQRQDLPPVELSLDLSWKAATPAPVPREALPAERNDVADRAIASCVDTARREQLSSYVASPALLYIGDPRGGAVPGFELSLANTAKIAGVAALVLALTVGASVLAGTRLVRPLHALTGAAQRMKDGEDTAPVPVTADNEIGRLAAAFNDMSAHRARLEAQRKAMVSDVAHELRTPLSNIRGWLEAAQDGLADPDPAFISSLLEEAMQLQHIVDDLQDLAEADAGALRLHPEPLRAAELLAQVAAAHQARAETAGVALAVDTGPPDGRPPAPALHADPVRLRQAVGNLVSNAVRHTLPGGRVTLRAYGSDDGGGAAALIEVADTGCGIPADDLPRVFDRFWRAEKSRSRRTGGSGLGLAIVRKLAEAHGGSARAESEEGKGSVFSLRIPAARPGP
ncbi:sensor histidine kinase [Streptomyces sp. MUM 178J]|uniref:sensor histidine kinase n=1 Tax=Streptomyces sp. MUM 178J TaxID=2791991 RepID=UPI001F03F1E1|nr:HAMP domain-containing sensor histidine kinase [Streptomyces sp. MUM 178J]WRQ79626.1 HAMP domain-containing sensor histidine kinase [Streptomyces sp. MUM 178J]